MGLDPHRLTLLVTGASQGSSTINALVPALAKQSPIQFRGWQVLHITGEAHVESVRDSWQTIDVPSKVVGFHHEMGDAWGAADLAVTRGGANTIAEIAFNAVPTIVMPYPYHKDDHQRTNALHLAHAGGVIIATDHIVLETNLSDAGKHILQLLSDHKLLFSMRQALASTIPMNGTSAIADACMTCIENSKVE